MKSASTKRRSYGIAGRTVLRVDRSLQGAAPPAGVGVPATRGDVRGDDRGNQGRSSGAPKSTPHSGLPRPIEQNVYGCGKHFYVKKFGSRTFENLNVFKGLSGQADPSTVKTRRGLTFFHSPPGARGNSGATLTQNEGGSHDCNCRFGCCRCNNRSIIDSKWMGAEHPMGMVYGANIFTPCAQCRTSYWYSARDLVSHQARILQKQRQIYGRKSWSSIWWTIFRPALRLDSPDVHVDVPSALQARRRQGASPPLPVSTPGGAQVQGISVEHQCKRGMPWSAPGDRPPREDRTKSFSPGKSISGGRGSNLPGAPAPQLLCSGNVFHKTPAAPMVGAAGRGANMPAVVTAGRVKGPPFCRVAAGSAMGVTIPAPRGEVRFLTSAQKSTTPAQNLSQAGLCRVGCTTLTRNGGPGAALGGRR